MVDVTFEYEVLIPAYCAQSTIERAVKSALGQTIAPKAVRVCVDGEVEGDLTAKRAAAAGATEVIVQKPNRGVGAARQTLLDHVVHELLVYLDSDDMLLPNASVTWCHAWSRHQSASVVAFGWTRPGEASSESALSVACVVYGWEEVWRRNPITSSAALVQTSALRSAGGYEGAARCLVDYEAWLRMGRHSNASFVVGELPVVEREVRRDSITGDVSSAMLREVHLVREYAPIGISHGRVTMRIVEAWVRGLSRQLDYERPASEYPTARLLPVAVPLAIILNLLRTRFGAAGWRTTRRLLGRRQ
jgi:glycosyltransferase involved in cell wall biosynthesis